MDAVLLVELLQLLIAVVSVDLHLFVCGWAGVCVCVHAHARVRAHACVYLYMCTVNLQEYLWWVAEGLQ